MKQIEIEFYSKSPFVNQEFGIDGSFISKDTEKATIVDGEVFFKKKRQENMRKNNSRIAELSSKLWRARK